MIALESDDQFGTTSDGEKELVALGAHGLQPLRLLLAGTFAWRGATSRSQGSILGKKSSGDVYI
jgi:hypothetical protein